MDMKSLPLIIVLLFFTGVINAQNTFQDYAKQQQSDFANFSKANQDGFKKYRDSLNMEYAKFLENEWKSFDLQKKAPPLINPIPKPPVFDNTILKPIPYKIPVIALPEQLKPLPIAMPLLIPTPLPKEKYNLKAFFFGTRISLESTDKPSIHLSGTSEKEVATYWTALSKLPHYNKWINDVLHIKAELQLNDWGVYLLLNSFFSAYLPQGSANEQVIFSVFMLNQLGYRAKIGRNANELVSLAAFDCLVYNTPYYTYNNIRYSVLNSEQKNLQSLQTCPMEYGGAKYNINMEIRVMPNLSEDFQTKVMSIGKDTFEMEYNKNVVNFCATYPCIENHIYAEAALDSILLESIETQIAPNILNKSQEEAVNFLLHFVQNAFQYKTDDEQFGHEKSFFAEETIASDYSDCEDRAILFTQLVRRLLKMPVVLVSYPGIHLATALKFQNQDIPGDYFTIDGSKYLICDPTYIDADLGMSMPELSNIAVEIIKLK